MDVQTFSSPALNFQILMGSKLKTLCNYQNIFELWRNESDYKSLNANRCKRREGGMLKFYFHEHLDQHYSLQKYFTLQLYGLHLNEFFSFGLLK